jgi:hypothetical protein
MSISRRFDGTIGGSAATDGDRYRGGMTEVSQISRAVEVTLREDLSRYHPSLRPGVVGRAVLPDGAWATATERYCRAQFPEVAVDVLASGLEVTDAAWLAEQQARVAERAIAIAATAKEAVRHVGQRGGFRKLVVAYVAAGEAREWVVRSDAERKKCEEVLARAGVPVREVVDR